MRTVSMRVRVPGTDPQRAYDLIRDFARYPELTDAVEEVIVNPPDADGSVVSEWLVHFRKGMLKWTERDVFEPDRRVIRFVQLSGDFDVFEGQWRVEERDAGSEICLDMSFDLGIPTLADLLDPVAEATFRANILRILSGIFGSSEMLADNGGAVTLRRSAPPGVPAAPSRRAQPALQRQ